MTIKKEATIKSPVKKKTTKAPTKKAAVTKAPVPAPAPRKRRKSKYLDRKELFSEVLKSKEIGDMTPRLAKMFQILTFKYAQSGRFIGYPFNEDMQAYAMMMLVRTWNSFNPERSDNPFAFYTQCIKNSFKQFLKSEKKQRNIRDELLVDKGMTPSYTYQVEYEATQSQNTVQEQDEEDHSQTVRSFELGEKLDEVPEE